MFSTQLLTLNYLLYSTTDAAPQFLQKLTPLFFCHKTGLVLASPHQFSTSTGKTCRNFKFFWNRRSRLLYQQFGTFFEGQVHLQCKRTPFVYLKDVTRVFFLDTLWNKFMALICYLKISYMLFLSIHSGQMFPKHLYLP